MSSSAACSGEVDGWEFWSQVYGNPGMRQQIAHETQKGPTVSELLRSDELCQGELIFQNVPRIGNNQQVLVRQLLNAELQRVVPVLDIGITHRRWKVRFYRAEDADEVQRRLDGLRYKTRLLVVRHTNVANPASRERNALPNGSVPSIEQQKQNTRSLTKAQQANVTTPALNDASFSPIEIQGFEGFKADVIALLSKHTEGITVDRLVEELRKQRYRVFITEALLLWPFGLLRMCQPQVRLFGRYASLQSHNLQRAHISKMIQERSSAPSIDEWEPMATCNIRTDSHLKVFMTALLTQFGPQHCKVDIPIRLFSRILPGQWPAGSVALCHHVASLSPAFLLFDDVLYLTTNVRHRRSLFDRLVPMENAK